MALYLITGGAGFIGSNIVSELIRRGENVRVLDNFSTGKIENLEAHLHRLELIRGDIRDLDTVRKAAAGVDYILHQAALPSVPRSVVDPLTSHEVNATGTLNILIAAKDAGVKKVVYASSSSVYGNNPASSKKEDMPTNPLSPYATAKLAGENYCKAFYHIYNLQTISLRYFNVFGPRQDPYSQYSAVIPKFIMMMMGGAAPSVEGDGKQSRDFTYVGNVVEANLKAAVQSGVAGRTFNIACGSSYTILQLIDELNKILRKKIEPVFKEARLGDVKNSLADISAARIVLDYEPAVSFSEGLRLTVDSLKKQG
jgi:nucleoside-diphosphate-sugar epimerase